MEAARPRTERRRPRRGSVDRPIDTRLLRSLWLVLAVPLLIVFATMSRTGPYPASTLPPAFDRATAVALTRDLALEHADRVPGTAGAAQAAAWFADNIRQYGLAVDEDAWIEDVPTLGRVELRNLVVVIPGSQEQAILLVAHRDNGSASAGANDNASGTASLIELARSFAAVGTGDAEPKRPLHTVILLSTDGGDFGGLGARRFVERSRLSPRVGAAIVLDGIASGGAPRLEVAGLDRTSPTQPLVRTLTARLESAASRTVERPSFLRQLVSLALPFGYGEQATLLSHGIPTVRLTTSSDARARPGTDEIENLNQIRLGQLGTAVEATLTSLDAAVELPRNTSSRLFIGRRAVRGWAVELLLIVATLPFAAAALDLAGRCRRRRLPLQPAWRSLRHRFQWWLAGGGAVFLASLTGILPRGSAVPPIPYGAAAERWPAITVGGALVIAFVIWAGGHRQRRGHETTDDERLAAWAATLLGLGLVTLAAMAVSPFLLVFLLPSLYAWLLVPHVPARHGWLPDLLFGIGFAGPVAALVTIALQLELGLSAPAYSLGLLTTGTVPAGATLVLLGFAATASQVGSLVTGSYTPIDEPSRRR